MDRRPRAGPLPPAPPPSVFQTARGSSGNSLAAPRRPRFKLNQPQTVPDTTTILVRFHKSGSERGTKKWSQFHKGQPPTLPLRNPFAWGLPRGGAAEGGGARLVPRRKLAGDGGGAARQPGPPIPSGRACHARGPTGRRPGAGGPVSSPTSRGEPTLEPRFFYNAIQQHSFCSRMCRAAGMPRAGRPRK